MNPVINIIGERDYNLLLKHGWTYFQENDMIKDNIKVLDFNFHGYWYHFDYIEHKDYSDYSNNIAIPKNDNLIKTLAIMGLL